MVVRFDYDDMLETANELIDEFGQDGTLVIPGAKTGDAWNPTVGTSTTEACVLVETDYDGREVDGTIVLATDKRLLVKAGDLDASIVQNASKITYGGTTYQVVRVKKINPAGTNLLWEVQARV